jgi:hypothetical protein
MAGAFLTFVVRITVGGKKYAVLIAPGASKIEDKRFNEDSTFNSA